MVRKLPAWSVTLILLGCWLIVPGGGKATARGAPSPQIALVSSAQGVIPINLITFRAETPIALPSVGIGADSGKSARFVILFHRAHEAYVTTSGFDVVRVNLLTGKVGRPVGTGLYDIAMAPDSDTAYVTAQIGKQSEIVPINALTGKEGKAIDLPKTFTLTSSSVTPSSDIAIAPNGQTAYVVGCDPLGARIVTVSLTTGSVGKSLRLPRTYSYAVGLALADKGRVAYVSSVETGSPNMIDHACGLIEPGGTGTSAIFRVSLANGRMSRPIRTPGVAYEIAISPGGTTGWLVATGKTDYLVSFDVSSGELRRAIRVPRSTGPGWVAFGTGSSTAYIATALKGDRNVLRVSALNTKSGVFGRSLIVPGGYGVVVVANSS